jgi:cytochrome P450
MKRDPLVWFTGLRERYGGLAALRLGPVRYLGVNDPELIRQVLVDDARGYKKGLVLERTRAVLGEGLLTSEGELHRRHARLAAPAFSPRRVAGYHVAMRELAEETSAGWRDGQVLDVNVEMTRLTLRIVVGTLFGSGLGPAEADRVGHSLTALLEHFEWLVTHPLGPLRLRIPTPRIRSFRAARAAIHETVAGLVAERTAAGTESDDLLSALLAARDDDGRGIDAVLLRDEVVTLLLAGHETTANWLTFCWLALAEHPAVEARLHGELDALGTAPVEAADLERLPYLRAVLEETLRLYPPAWGVGRRALEQRTLGGYDVPRRAVLGLSQFAVHRDARFWTAPERFAPERWLDPAAERVPRGAFFPFGDGPRRCIGEHFARAEAAIVLATLARAWSPDRATHEPVELEAKVTLRPRGGLRMRVAAR